MLSDGSTCTSIITVCVGFVFLSVKIVFGCPTALSTGTRNYPTTYQAFVTTNAESSIVQ